MKRTMTIKDSFALGAWRLDGARETRPTTSTAGTSAVRRAVMMLLMMLLTTATAWAQEVEIILTTDASQYVYRGHENTVKPTVERVSYGDEDDIVVECTIIYGDNNHAGEDAGIVYVTLPSGDIYEKTFTITKAPLTVTAVSDSKYYDGTPLTCNSYIVDGLLLNDQGYNHSATVTGSQTKVGASTNVPSAFYLYGIESNYDITYVPGTLTVTPNPDDWEETNTNEYTIKTATGWDIFCDLLEANSKGYFNGKTVKLGANISVTRMAGSDGYEFTGTFDGQGNTLTVSYGSSDSPITEEYAAPFRYVDGVTIENLRVCGTIYTSAQYAGGFIGIAEGSASIVNSVSGVTINSSIVGDGTHGGFVGLQGDNEGNTLGIEGCVFNGKLLGSSTNSCGGFVGWRKKTVNILNSLYAPAAATGSETWIDTGSCATFSRNGANFTNCYYTETLGNAQVYQARSISAGVNVTVAHAGLATTYGVSGITAYKASAESSSFTDGLLYNNVLYAGKYDAVSLTLANTPPTGYSFVGYTTYTTSLDGAMLTRDGDNYTLTMPDADVTIGATFMELVSVSYIDTDGKEQTVDAFQLQGGGATMLPAGWYVVNSDVTYTGTVTLGGDVNIILADDKTMTVKTNEEYGIKGTSNALTIYGTGTLNANRPIYCAFTMTGGTVNATSNPCGIAGNVTVSGGTLNATGHIAIYGDVTVTGGTLTVTSTEGLARRRSDWPMGYNRFAITGNLALSGPATVTLNGYVKDDVTIADGLTFTDGDGNNDYSGTLGYEKQTAIQGKTLTPFTIDGTAILYDNDTGLPDGHRNADRLTTLDDSQTHNIMLLGRTLYKDGDWNTLCLPFAMTDEQIAASPLADADIRALSPTIEHEGATTGFDPQTGTLTLNFTPAAPASGAVTAIQPSVPYIVKWDSGDDITDPVFQGVTVAAGTPADHAVTSVDGTVSFTGSYSPVSLAANDQSVLYLGAANKLYWPSAVRTIGAFRALFRLDLGDLGPGSASVRSFVLNFGDGTTSLSEELRVKSEEFATAEGWYTQDGRKLNGQPTKKGLYIHNGRKVVIP